MKFFRQHIILIFILITGLFFRTFQLGENPSGLFCDEASIGFDAYSLLSTGHDQWGVKWPLFFKAFGEYKSPVMTYSAIPFVAIFGLNDFSIRLASVFWGMIGIYALYFFGTIMFNKKVGLISAFFLESKPISSPSPCFIKTVLK